MPVMVADDKPHISNFYLDTVTEDGKQKNYVKAKTLDQLLIDHPMITTAFRRVGTSLYYQKAGIWKTVTSYDEFEIGIQDLFTITWDHHPSDGERRKFVSWRALYLTAMKQSQAYSGTSELPHVPTIPKILYTKKFTPVPTPHKLFHLLMAQLYPHTKDPMDLILIKAMFITPMWGGPRGTRPIFLIKGQDQNVGKSSLAEMVINLYGGAIDYNKEQPDYELEKRLFSDEHNQHRIIYYDNCKIEDDQRLSAMVTQCQWQGRGLGKESSHIDNNHTIIITMNRTESGLQRDLSTRSCSIMLMQPTDKQRQMFSQINQQVAKNQQRILSIIHNILSDSPAWDVTTGNTGTFRFREFAQQVIGRLCDSRKQFNDVMEYINQNIIEDDDETSTMHDVVLAIVHEARITKKNWVPIHKCQEIYNKLCNQRLKTTTVGRKLKVYLEKSPDPLLKHYKTNKGNGLKVIEKADLPTKVGISED